ncbi:MAG TPA: hypothetical protein VM802_05095 [Chitinophaga sp.]|uniref:hypothetical protein n=1 Tax=Chitinophaga sp. TaxID=1869181 RepID=UPI002C5409AB|nr:hypothetical protein [Chitinophaga sp.]HVI44218.1 hypothetical protein [Chitinophaga sp.]
MKMSNTFYLAVLATLLTTGTAMAQNTFPATGNVGIGTATPGQKLTLDFGATRNSISMISDGDANAYSDLQFAVKTGTTVPTGNPNQWIISHRKDAYFTGGGTALTSLEFYCTRVGGGYYAPLAFKANGDVILASPYQTSRSGNVGIGTTNPGSYKLAVEGTIGARKVKVTQAAWADYVFSPDYKLPTLAAVEAFIKAHGHLPDVPSAAEVTKDGLDLAEINKQQMQKIEELTLYLIQQQKTIEQQQQRIDKMEKQLNRITGSSK